MNTCIIGKFDDKNRDRQEYLTLNFAPTSAPQRQQRWHNNGLSADFLGDYFATFFLGDPATESAIDLKGTVKGAVSYIANELLENALKYSAESTDLPISITLYLEEREIVFQAVNYADVARAKEYRQFIEKIDSGDLDEIYMEQLEKTSVGSGGSGMGILTILQDYSAQGGWKFESLPGDPDLVQVSVSIYLAV